MRNMHWAASFTALAMGLAATPAAAQQVIIVPQGTTRDGQISVRGTDSVAVQPDGTLTSSGSPTINWDDASSALRIVNSGTIRSTAAGGRAIDASGPNNARVGTLTNEAGALIESENDAFRVGVSPTSGTIRVENRGIIRSTNGGQALDFDAVAGGATIIINNYASGEIRSYGQDAIRPGQGATITNAGLIYSDGPIGNSYDAIDWQSRTGTVVNQASGTISGLRHGITGNVSVNVTNDGTIIGRNGSGVGSDGTGTVVNRGTITGRWDGVSPNGDGDGIDIDLIGQVTNFGTIQGVSAAGVDSGGRPNTAQGVAMGGGTIDNRAGASIIGGAQGVLINLDTNPGGAAVGATTISNAGTIRGNSAEGILLVGDFADTLSNSGTIIGGNGVAVDMGGGNDTLNLSPSGSFTGIVNGGAGDDRIVLGSTSASATFNPGNFVNFERLTVDGRWTVTAPLNFSGGVTFANGAQLTGDASAFTGNLTNARLALDQRTDGTLSATFTGNPTIEKFGAGTLTITNAIAAGNLYAYAGTVRLTSSFMGTVNVIGSGTTLTGSFTAGTIKIDGSAVLSPGDGIGTIVANALQSNQGFIRIETSGTGAADMIRVLGAVSGSATLVITRDSAPYKLGQTFTVMNFLSGNISLQLSQTPVNGTEFQYSRLGNSIVLVLARTRDSLVTAAATSNQRAVAPAVVANGGWASELTRIVEDRALQGALDSLSGEVHATLRNAAIADARLIDTTVLNRLEALDTGSGFWGRYLSSRAHDDFDGNATATSRSGWGAAGGIDARIGDARIGFGVGYTDSSLYSAATHSIGRYETLHSFGYAGGDLGGFTLRTGAGFSWVKNRTTRRTELSIRDQPLTARYDARILHGFGEAGLPLAMRGGTVEPFAGFNYYRIDSDAFQEQGIASGLRGDARRSDYSLATLGARSEAVLTKAVTLRSRVAWQHVLGETALGTRMRYQVGGDFEIRGNALTRDSATASVELSYRAHDQIALSIGYDGLISKRNTAGTFRASASVGF